LVSFCQLVLEIITVRRVGVGQARTVLRLARAALILVA